MSAPASRSSRAYKRLHADVRARRDPCHICGKPIDYALEYPDRRSFSLHHKKPWATHPELRLDPENSVAAHLDCNQGHSAGEDPRDFELLPLGEPSRHW